MPKMTQKQLDEIMEHSSKFAFRQFCVAKCNKPTCTKPCKAYVDFLESELCATTSQLLGEIYRLRERFKILRARFNHTHKASASFRSWIKTFAETSLADTLTSREKITRHRET